MATVAGERPSRMEAQADKMSPTLSLEESIREFRNHHLRLKQRRSSTSPASYLDEGRRLLRTYCDINYLFLAHRLISCKRDFDLLLLLFDLRCMQSPRVDRASSKSRIRTMFESEYYFKSSEKILSGSGHDRRRRCAEDSTQPLSAGQAHQQAHRSPWVGFVDLRGGGEIFNLMPKEIIARQYEKIRNFETQFSD